MAAIRKTVVTTNLTLIAPPTGFVRQLGADCLPSLQPFIFSFQQSMARWTAHGCLERRTRATAKSWKTQQCLKSAKEGRRAIVTFKCHVGGSAALFSRLQQPKRGSEEHT